MFLVHHSMIHTCITVFVKHIQSRITGLSSITPLIEDLLKESLKNEHYIIITIINISILIIIISVIIIIFFFLFADDYTGRPVAVMNEAVLRRSPMAPYSLLCVVVACGQKSLLSR